MIIMNRSPGECHCHTGIKNMAKEDDGAQYLERTFHPSQSTSNKLCVQYGDVQRVESNNQLDDGSKEKSSAGIY